MHRTSSTEKTVVLALLFAAMVLPASLTFAQQVVIFDEDLIAFTDQRDLGDGTTYGALIIPPVTVFNDGNALRMFDFNGGKKPNIQGDLTSTLFEGFTVDFQSFDQGTTTNESPAIRWRMGNVGKIMDSSSRAAFSLSWSADGSFTASYDTGTGSVSAIRSVPLAGVKNVKIVANGTANLTYSYTLTVPRTLDPLSYDVYIDGVLFNDTSAFPDIPGTGLPFSEVAEYNPSLGIARFGLLGSSDANTDPDVLFDNIILEPFAINPSPQSIVSVQTLEVDGLSFLSATGATYALQWSTNATAELPDWADAGVTVEGDGGTRVLFDPQGYDIGKTYRVIEVD